MTIRRVPLAITEAAVHYLHATYVDYARMSAAVPPRRGRIHTGGTALGVYDFGSTSKQTCFFRLISIVEAYVDTLSSELFRRNAPTTHDLVRRLVESTELRASTTWKERKAAFDQFHQIRLGQLKRWSELDAGIEVRNAIAHGLGQLTPRQRRRATTGKLGQIGVGLRNGGVVVTDASLRRCRDVCVEFVRSLDDSVRQGRP